MTARPMCMSAYGFTTYLQVFSYHYISYFKTSQIIRPKPKPSTLGYVTSKLAIEDSKNH